MKSLQDVCDHYECFPPGHYYVGRSTHAQKGEMKQFYKQKWFVDQVRLYTVQMPSVEA